MSELVQHTTNVYEPAPKSLSFRANLAKLVTPLRRVRPRVPFWHLAAHRIPTLWDLYRGLLRGAEGFKRHEEGRESEEQRRILRGRVKVLMRKNQHLTGTERTTTALKFGYKLLDYLDLSRTSAHHASLLARYTSFLAHRQHKRYWNRLLSDSLSPSSLPPSHSLYERPHTILTGGILRASIYLPALPRMKPQPPEISAIYRKRMRTRTKRHEKIDALTEDCKDVQREAEGEEMLYQEIKSTLGEVEAEKWKEQCVWWDGGYYGGEVEAAYEEDEPQDDEPQDDEPKDDTQALKEWLGEKQHRPPGRKAPPCPRVHSQWLQPIKELIRDKRRFLSRDYVRAQTPPSPELLALTKAARREKNVNKTRELERERRGEILKRTLRRGRSGVPPHIWDMWSDERKRMELIARSNVTETGYVGLVKKKLGWTLKDPDSWRIEEGPQSEEVDRLVSEVMDEVEKRGEAFMKEAEESNV